MVRSTGKEYLDAINEAYRQQCFMAIQEQNQKMVAWFDKFFADTARSFGWEASDFDVQKDIVYMVALHRPNSNQGVIVTVDYLAFEETIFKGNITEYFIVYSYEGLVLNDNGTARRVIRSSAPTRIKPKNLIATIKKAIDQ